MQMPNRSLWSRIVAWTTSIAGVMLAYSGHVSLNIEYSVSRVNSIVIAGGILCLIGLFVVILRKIWVASIVGMVAAFLCIVILYIQSSTSTVDSLTVFISLSLSVFMGVIICLIDGLFKLLKVSWEVFHVGMSLIGFCVSALVVGSTILNIQFTHTCHIGENMVQAITLYYRDHSHYPDSLETLVPHYLSHIPSSSMRWGKETFGYWIPTIDEPMQQPFYLSFQVDEQDCYYYLEKQHWLCGGS